jgi:parallel beta-helix repeat protein
VLFPELNYFRLGERKLLRRVISGIMLTLLLMGMLTLAFNVQPVRASGTIYIRADGTIDPPTAPIQRDGDVYTFTADIYDSIVVERDNIVIDGAGYTLQGTGTEEGVTMWERDSITIKNMKIKEFYNGIRPYYSSRISILGNSIESTGHAGVYLYHSSGNTVSGNSIEDNWNGVYLESSDYNTVFDNNIRNNDWHGVIFFRSWGNGLCKNDITNNHYGLYLAGGANTIYHNNIINNVIPVYLYESGYINVWDDGYPSGGNYWSDYTDVDLNNDGIWDHPYVIDVNNQDRYPLVNPWTPTNTATRATGFAKSLIGAKYQFGAGGYCFDRRMFVSKEDILQNGYGWNPEVRKQYGTGIDCSGLVFWSYNKATGNLVYGDSIVPRTANAQYRAVQPVSRAELKPGDLLFFDAYRDSHNGGYTLPGQDGHIDHVAMYVGDYQYSGTILGKTYSGNYDVVEATGIGAVLPQTVDSIIARIQGTYGKKAFVGYGRVIEQVAPVKMKFIKKSPVEMNVTDPEGFTITKDVNETESMFYRKLDINGDGKLEDVVCAWEKKLGDYLIKIAPQPGAAPNDTYTIEVLSDNMTTVVAENVTVSNIPDQPYIVTANETTIIPRLDPHDLGITRSVVPKTIVGQGFSLPVNVTVFNYGHFAETFNVTLFANETIIAAFTNITLTTRNSTTVTFTWNTTGFAKGNYTIKAIADTVPGETYTADNKFTGGVVTVTIPGDLDGNYAVQLVDLVTLAKAYGSKPGEPAWNPNADIDDNGVVDLTDLVTLAKNYGKTAP